LIDRASSRLGISFASLSALAAALLLWPGLALAAGSNMPWEQPLTQILDSIQGPVAKIIAVIIIIGSGLALAFGEPRAGCAD
jgi:type IV secretory pathway VirB2 component (pilin)